MATTRRYVRPQLDESGVIDIDAGRHPTLEALLGPGEFVPNDARLDPESQQIIILTGPNMAGKSSWLRQVALIVLMAQIGSFVPAVRHVSVWWTAFSPASARRMTSPPVSRPLWSRCSKRPISSTMRLRAV